jgi:hypothetical protein
MIIIIIIIIIIISESCKWDARDIINSFMVFIFVLYKSKISTHGTRKCSDHSSVLYWCARYE